MLKVAVLNGIGNTITSKQNPKNFYSNTSTKKVQNQKLESNALKNYNVEALTFSGHQNLKHKKANKSIKSDK